MWENNGERLGEWEGKWGNKKGKQEVEREIVMGKYVEVSDANGSLRIEVSVVIRIGKALIWDIGRK